MKNLFIKLIALTLALFMVFAFVACKEETKDETPTPSEPDTNAPNDDANTDDKDDWFSDGGNEEEEEDDTEIEDIPEFTYDGIWWFTGRGGSFFNITLKEDGNEFHWKSDKDGKTWKWNITAGDFETIAPIELEEGTIEAVFTPNANIGITFGAHNFNVPKDGSANVLGTPDVKYYYARYMKDGTLSFCIDGGDENKLTIVQSVIISDIIPTFDATADIKLKVDFTKDGAVKIFVNDFEIYSFTDYVPFGTQFGMLVEDGTGFEATAVVGTVKSFTYTAAGAEDTPAA